MNPIDELAKFLERTLFDSPTEPARIDQIIESFRALLAPAHFNKLMMEMGICPDHACDIAICDDDNENCSTKFENA